MAENSKIEWTTHTFNPVMGCTRVSPGCDHCYAETLMRRYGKPELWQGARQRTSPGNWKKPLAWNRAAERDGVRPRVFCASLSDVFDNGWESEWRRDLFDLIRVTPHLDWQLLTKRPQNIARMLPEDWGDGWPNVWLGCTIENSQEQERRAHALASVPAKITFWSCEPMLGPIQVGPEDQPDWLICGGESGPGKRPMNLAWARSLRDQCAAADIAFFFKQIDKVQPIPPDLLVREFPRAA